MKLSLLRHAYLPLVTLGRLYAADLILPSLEESWRPDPDGPGGQRREAGKKESCIPDGTYRVLPHTRPKDGAKVWVLENVELGVYHRDTDIPAGQRWGRSYVLIHRGNTVDDIEGCILVGTGFGKLDGLDAVLDSGTAIQQLFGILGHSEEHILTIGPTLGTTQKGTP